MISNGPRRSLILVAFAGLLAACAPAGEGASSNGEGVRTIQVQMTDELRFAPAEYSVQAGETVRFEIINGGQIVHEFLIGGEAAQDEFEMQMSDGGGMAHDPDAGVSVEPGATETFEYTFEEAGQLLAGCHEPGHYDGGMVATISVED